MTEESSDVNQVSEGANQVSNGVSQESKNMSVMIWVGTILFGFIPGLIFYMVKKDAEFVLTHSKEALNLSITVMIGFFIGLVLTIVLVGFLVIPVVGIYALVVCIMGAFAAYNGKPFRAPFAIRLIK
jgi:hypothetical protein